MCEVLEVSRSGYYAWRNRKPGKRWKENEHLLDRVKEIHQKSRKVYGSPRIRAELRDQGSKCGKNRIARIMKDNGIRAELKRRFRKTTTQSKHNYSLAANLLIDRNHKRSAVGIGYHVCSDQRRLALRIGGHERADQKDNRVVHEQSAIGGFDSYSA
jgi:transposase InsO family protein